MFMFTLGALAGGAVIWFWKEQVQLFYMTGYGIAKALEAKAAAIREKL